MTTEYSPPSSCLPLSHKIVTLQNNETLQGHSFASLDPDEGRIKRRWPDAHGLLGRRQFIVCLSSFYSAREGTRRPSYARASSKFLPSPYTKNYSRLPITRTLANSNQNRFLLDFRHTFTVILPSITRTLDNSHSR